MLVTAVFARISLGRNDIFARFGFAPKKDLQRGYQGYRKLSVIQQKIK